MPRLLMIHTVGEGPTGLDTAVDSDATVTLRRAEGLPAGFASAHDWAQDRLRRPAG